MPKDPVANNRRIQESINVALQFLQAGGEQIGTDKELTKAVELARQAVVDEGWLTWQSAEDPEDPEAMIEPHTIDGVTIFFFDAKERTHAFVLFTLLSHDKSRHMYELVAVANGVAFCLDQIVNGGIRIRRTIPVLGAVNAATGKISSYGRPYSITPDDLILGE